MIYLPLFPYIWLICIVKVLVNIPVPWIVWGKEGTRTPTRIHTKPAVPYSQLFGFSPQITPLVGGFNYDDVLLKIRSSEMLLLSGGKHMELGVSPVPFVQLFTVHHGRFLRVPSTRELAYPTLRKGKSSSKVLRTS